MKLITTLLLAAACLATAQVKKPIPLTVDATTGAILGAPGAALFGSANSLGGGGGSADALGNGTAALPSVAFASDPNTGIYRVGENQLGISTGGVLRVTYTTSGVTYTIPLTLPNGTVGAPGLTFAGDATVGLFQTGGGLSLAADGGTVLNASPSYVTSTPPIRGPNGSGAPAFTFNGDEDTGFLRLGANIAGVFAGNAEIMRFTTTGAAITGSLTISTPLAVAQGGSGAATGGGALTNYGLTANGVSLVTAADYAAMKVLLSLNNVQNTALTTWTGANTINTVGTVTTGTWNATVIGQTYGGFGVSVAAVNGIPLFASGTPTFTGTSGTGNFARVDSPTFTTQLTTPLVTNGGSTLALAGGDITFSAAGSVRATVTSSLLTLGSNVGIAFAGTGAATTKTNLSLNNVANVDTTVATNISSGTLPDGRFPATLPAASGVNLTALNATQLTSGTVPDARFPATLPAANGSLLTALNATQLTSGTMPSGRGVPLLANNFNDLTDYFASRNNLGVDISLPAWRTFNQMVSVYKKSPLSGVPDGLSGATYNIRSGTFFAVRNVSGSNGNVYEVTADGTVLRVIANSGFVDTESIEYITSVVYSGTGTAVLYDVFVIGEEDGSGANGVDESQLTICYVKPTDMTITRTAANGSDPDNVTATTAYTGTGAGTPGLGNLGIESVAYDRRRGLIYYTPEKQTNATNENVTGTAAAKIKQRSITIPAAAGSNPSFGSESNLCDINALYTGGTNILDISDMSYDYINDQLLLQSHESFKVVRIALDGTFIESLATPLSQPEGLAITPDGKLMIVCGEVSGNAGSEWFKYSVGAVPALAPEPVVRTVGMSNDATANSTTTGVEIHNVQCPLGIGHYTFQYFIRTNAAATTTGVKFGVNYNAANGTFMANMRYPSSATAASDGSHSQAVTVAGIMEVFSTRTESTTAPNLGPTLAADNTGDMLTIIEGVITTTAAGDLELWHASEVAASSTVKAGTCVIVHRIY